MLSWGVYSDVAEQKLSETEPDLHLSHELSKASFDGKDTGLGSDETFSISIEVVLSLPCMVLYHLSAALEKQDELEILY